MGRLGLEADEKTVRDVIKEVDADADGSVNLEEWLDIAAGVKELHLTSAFADIAVRQDAAPVPEGDEGKNRAGGNEPPKKDGQKIDYSSKTPPERTGGGW
ncbi:hypothetical protein JCM11251_001973 [Rhodosporidiobolus azoricus]